MDIIRLIVKSILVIIFVAVLLEIMLPRSDMKRYVNLIIGLFVIIAVLNPLLGLLNKELDFDVFEGDIAATGADTQTLIQKGREMGESQKARAVSQYKENLSKQVAALARLYPDAQIREVEVEMVEDVSDPEFGRLKRIVLYRGEQGPGGNDSGSRDGVNVQEVQVGEIQIRPGETGPDSDTENRSGNNEAGLKEVIAGFYGLAPEQIVVQN